jgi:hypothetical protein
MGGGDSTAAPNIASMQRPLLLNHTATKFLLSNIENFMFIWQVFFYHRFLHFVVLVVLPLVFW